ncbi:MAG: hypothetical protein PHS02_02530, partial [Candidatus ainarchaeum sp.]|nr:hypothetical protein [Candidatus ainarchaeum sp.]
MLWKRIFQLSERFPEIGISSRSVEKHGKKLLKKPQGYVTLSLVVSMLGGLGAAVAFGWSGIIGTAAAFFMGLALVFFIMVDAPRRIENERRARLEAEMPLVVRMLAMLLPMKIQFARALEASAEYEEAGVEIRRALESAKRGTGLSKALAAVAEESESPMLKRVFAQIITAYESEGSEGVARLAQDLVSLQKYGMRD